MKSVAAKLTIGLNFEDTRIGIITFASSVVHVVSLGAAGSIDSLTLNNTIDAIGYNGGATCTSTALNHTALFALTLPPRRPLPTRTSVLLITDGKPNKYTNDDCDTAAGCICDQGPGLGSDGIALNRTITNSQFLRSIPGVKLYALGINGNGGLDDAFLQSFTDDYVLVEDFSDVLDTVNKVEELSECHPGPREDR